MIFGSAHSTSSALTFKHRRIHDLWRGAVSAPTSLEETKP